ncbi:restriction endonuclease subunit S [Psychrobacter immobilis]|uniref:restriction endonuclease subunit S n=2 Tax=Psychrobacter TaxID=497 RepID=UPI0019184A8D|nr:restriction endonuclease subunit S [Psychrobacter immobilis]
MKLVELKEVFKTEYGNSLALSDMDEGSIPFIARGSKNNGVSSYVAKLSDINSFKGHAITVALSGSVLESFYQETPFYTGYHIKVLVPLKELTKTEMLIYCSFITANKYRYNYGRQANKTLEIIKIPHPDEIKRLTNSFVIPDQPNRASTLNKKLSLRDRSWKWFCCKDLFEVFSRGKCNNAPKLLENGNEIDYIGAKKSDNGVVRHVMRNSNLTFKGNALVFITNGQGSVGYSLYQGCDFIPSSDLVVAYSEHLNHFTGLFLVAVLDQERYRYSFGRKYGKSRILSSEIKLPVNSKGDPDWQFMEDYIKSLPYSSNL